ncbi:MAG TPA: hypothetical protein VMT74_00640 [Gaiellaceae bacterium]|nr:hypothetical protein [Gaiellaceae bacterium]
MAVVGLGLVGIGRADSFDPSKPHAWISVVHGSIVRSVYDSNDIGVGVEWSPSGDEFAFSPSLENGNHAVFVADDYGGDLHQVWTGTDAVSATFSPDGTRLMLDGGVGLSFVDADGTFPSHVRMNDTGVAYWLDDTHVVVVQRKTQHDSLVVVDSRTGTATRLPANLGWLNDVAVENGRLYAQAWYHDTEGVFAVDARGTIRKILANDVTSPLIAVSGDGRRIAVAGVLQPARGPSTAGVWVGTPGGRPRLVMHLSSGDVQALSWSTDGRKLLVQEGEQDGSPTRLTFSLVTWPASVRRYALAGKFDVLQDGVLASDGSAAYFSASAPSGPLAAWRLDLTTGHLASLSDASALTAAGEQDSEVVPSPTDPGTLVRVQDYDPFTFAPTGGTG